MEWTRQHKRLLTTEGTDVHADVHLRRVRHASRSRVGDDGLAQRRSYPTWQGGDGLPGGLRAHRRARPHGARRPRRGRGARAALRAALPRAARATSSSTRARSALQIHESCGHPDGARSRARERDLARRRLVPAAATASASCGTARRIVDLVADATTRGRQRHLRLGRRGRPRRQAAARRARALRRLPLEPRDRRRARPRLDRHDARRRVEPHAHHPHGERLARAGRGGLARGPRRRHRRRRARRDRQELEHRRPPPQLPVLVRDRLGDQARQAHAHPSRPALHRASRRGSGARATRSAARDEWRLWGITTCGKGDPMQIDAGRPRRIAGALPRGHGGTAGGAS